MNSRSECEGSRYDADAPWATVLFSARLPKPGAGRDECEDRFANGCDLTARLFRAAVADGASASLMSGEWAELLVDAYCASPAEEHFAYPLGPERILTLRADWKALAAARSLPWYAAAKRAEGAFAAIVGVTLAADGHGWADARGDCCVFQLRGERLIWAFPLHRSGQFTSTPNGLIGTAPAPGNDGLQRHEFSWECGDDLYLMSDALAEWFLREVEIGRDPWRWLEALTAPANPLPFDRFVDGLRTEDKIQSDDVTLLHIHLTRDGKEAAP